MRTETLRFDTLPARAAYAVWRLRQDVFVVEQACPYPDLDGRDLEPGTRHVLGWESAEAPGTDDSERLVGYARVLDDGEVWRIGRVVLARHARGRGLADPLLRAALDACVDPDDVSDVPRGVPRDVPRDIVLDAQSPLAPWYAGFGFEVTGPEFLEDGIPHLPMRLPR